MTLVLHPHRVMHHLHLVSFIFLFHVFSETGKLGIVEIILDIYVFGYRQDKGTAFAFAFGYFGDKMY